MSVLLKDQHTARVRALRLQPAWAAPNLLSAELLPRAIIPAQRSHARLHRTRLEACPPSDGATADRRLCYRIRRCSLWCPSGTGLHRHCGRVGLPRCLTLVSSIGVRTASAALPVASNQARRATLDVPPLGPRPRSTPLGRRVAPGAGWWRRRLAPRRHRVASGPG